MPLTNRRTGVILELKGEKRYRVGLLDHRDRHLIA